MQPIRVMIVEDSRVVREFLTCIINNDPRLEVAASVENAEDALRQLAKVQPDVISMDVRLPGMSGLEATQRIMAEKPTPIVVVSASIEASDLSISINALRAGALSVVEKPVGSSHADYEMLAARLCTQLAIMSQVNVVRQRITRHLQFRPPAADSAGTSFSTSRPPRGGALGIVGIVASTGGPKALQTILGQLPSDFPAPIVVVQHITSSFNSGFIRWLDEVSALSVCEIRTGQVLRSSMIYVPPADRHVRVGRHHLYLDSSDPVCAQRPSGTVLFETMAHSWQDLALGVLLTGMGEDGAAGLATLLQAGGYTLAEDESTAVVYGMPAAAVRRGAVRESLPLDRIAPRIVQLVRSPEAVT